MAGLSEEQRKAMEGLPKRVTLTDRRPPSDSLTGGLTFTVPADAQPWQINEAFDAARKGYTPPVIPKAAEPPPNEPVPPATPPPPAPSPRAVVISTGKPNGAQAEVEYALMEADALEPLIVRQVGENQTRPREGNRASNEQIAKIAASPDINFLSESPTSLVGAPVVDDVVLAGNSRAAGLAMGYRSKTKGAEAYRQAVLEVAKRLGLDATGIKNPVLIRRLKRITRGTRAQFVVESNPKYALLQETLAEQARLDARALGNIAELEFTEGGSLSPNGTLEAARRLEAAQRGVMRSQKGSFDTGELNKRVQLAALADLAERNNMPFSELSNLIETDLGKRFVAELIRVAPRMSRLDADLTLAAPWLRALQFLQRGIRSVGERAYNSLTEWNNERRRELLQDPLSPEADFLIDLMVEFEKKPLQFRNSINDYLNYADNEQNERNAAGQSGDLLRTGARAPITASQLVERVKREKIPPPETAGTGVPPPVSAELPVEPSNELREEDLLEGVVLEKDKKTGNDVVVNTEAMKAKRDQWIEEFKKSPTFANLWRAYFYGKLYAGGGLPKSYIGYITHANNLLKMIPQLQTASILELDADDLIAWFKTPAREAYNNRTGHSYTSRRNQLQYALDWAEGQKSLKGLGLASGNIMQDVPRVAQNIKIEAAIRPGEKLQSLFDKIRSLPGKWAQDAADMAEMLAYTGLRPSELLQLRWSDVNFEDGTARIWQPKKKGKAKQKPPIDFVMNEALRNTLLRIRQQNPKDNFGNNDWLNAKDPALARDENPGDFVVKFALGSPLDIRLSQFNTDYTKPASVKLGGYESKDVTADDFRNFFINHAANMGVADQFVFYLHGRSAPKVAGGGATPEYRRWIAESKPEAAKLKFGTRADAGIDQQALPQKKGAKKKGAPPAASPASPPKLGAGEKGTGDLLKNAPDQPFNLAGGTAPDVERQQAEQAAAEQRAREAREAQEKQQQNLFPPDQPPPAPPASPAPPESPDPNLGEGLAPGEGMSPEEAQQAIANEETFGFPVQIITQEQAAQIVGSPNAAGWGGFFFNGTIYVVANNVQRGNKKGALEILREEIGHGLLRTPEGRQLLQRALAEGKLQLTEKEKQALRDQGYSEDRLLDEFIAKSAREGQPWWQSLVDAVANFFAKLGFTVSNATAARILLKNIRADMQSAEATATSADEAGLNLAQVAPSPADAPPAAAEPSFEGSPTTHNIASQPYTVPGKDSFTAAEWDAARGRVINFVQDMRLPGAPDTSQGRRRGNIDTNVIYTVEPDGFSWDAEVRNTLIPEIQRAFQNQNSRPDSAYASTLINFVSKNFRRGNWNELINQDTLRELLNLVRQEASFRAQELQALTGVGLDEGDTVARNLDFSIRRIWSDSYGGPEVRALIGRVLTEFRSWFTDAELQRFDNAEAGAARDELERLVTRLTGLNRQDEGGRVYRFTQRLFKPKFAKTLARLEADDRVKRTVEEIVEQLRNQGIRPRPPVGKTKLTALESLLYMVQPETAAKIDAAIADAVRQGELNAGKKYALSQITDEAERQDREDRFEAGEEPSEREIELGLENPEFVHWRILGDALVPYNPITIKHAQDIISERFKGTEKDNIYGTPIVRPADTRIDIKKLAKEPDAEVARVFGEFMANINANMDVRTEDAETQLRVAQVIVEEFERQLRIARESVLNNFLQPPVRMPAPTEAERMGQLLNARLARDPRFRDPRVVRLLQRVSQKFAKQGQFDDLAVQTKEEKAAWVVEAGQQIVNEIPELAAMPEDAPFRQFAEQVIFNDLATRLQLAESRLVRRILEGKDAKLGNEPVDQERVVQRLNDDRDRLRGAINAGLIDTAMIDSVANKTIIQPLLPTLNQMIRQAMDKPLTQHEDIARNFADALVNDLNVDPANRDKLMKLIETAYGNKFREARKIARERAVASATPKELKPLRRRKAVWEIIERIVNAGGMDEGTVLENIAAYHKWKPITPEVRERFKQLVTRMDELRELTPAEAEKFKNDPAGLERANRDRFATTQGERIRLKKEIEARWAKITKPIDMRTRDGRQNFASAAMEVSAANLLLRLGFPFKQMADILTQGIVHAPTRALAPAFERFMRDIPHGWRHTNFFKDAALSLRDAYKTRFTHLRETLASTALSLKGTQDARNVERLLSGIAAFERLQIKGDELAAKGNHAASFATRLLGLMQWGFRIAQAFDNLHGTPAEFQEMHQDAVNHLIEQGIPRSVSSARATELIKGVNAEWADALTLARQNLENAGLPTNSIDVRGAAANIIKARAYHRMREAGMPADDFEEKARLLRNTIGWNEKETGGFGGVAASSFAKLREVSQKAPLPISLFGSVFNFGNAIGTSINRTLSFTPMGFWPQLFGVEAAAIDKNQDAARGSPWYRTPTDRVQRKLEATIGTGLGGMALALAWAGIIIVRNGWPRDKEERELWEREGHRPYTVEFPTKDGFIPFSMTSGPLAVLRPWLAAGGALHDLFAEKAKAQERLNAEAARNGVAPGKVTPISAGDMLGVAGEAARGAIIGGRTASGLWGTFSDYGIPNVKKIAAGLISPYVPGLPALQEVSRMAGVKLDAKMASVMDFLLPLPGSQAAAVNMLGDSVGTEKGLQRVVQTLTGGTYPGEVNVTEAQDTPAYRTLFETGYRPPSINSNQGYDINGTYRPLSNTELSKYTRLRGQYFKEALLALPADATKEQAQGAYQGANNRALTAVGVSVGAPRRAVQPLISGSSGGGGGSSRRVGGRVRSSFGRSSRVRRLRVPRLRRTRSRVSRVRSSFRRRRSTGRVRSSLRLRRSYA